MSGILVYSERETLAHDLVMWARAQPELAGPISAAVLGAAVSEQAAALQNFGPHHIYAVEHPALAGLADDVVAAALTKVVELAAADLVLIGATRRGRSVAPRLAQALGAGCVSEAVEITMEAGRLEVGRYALGGNTIARERILTKRAVISVLPAALPRAEQGAAGGEVLPVALELPAARVVVAERREKSAVGVDISASERLVCVGRGLADRDDLAMIEECARALGADVACSRALSYEYGWLPEARMIGISGQKCSPRLLLSLGVSGQVQHTVGITGAHTIVAVNTDANAPIFKLADYGIVGDLYQVVPVLLQYLRDRV